MPDARLKTARSAVTQLVEAHTELTDEPLLPAINDQRDGDSDLLSADRVFDAGDPRTWCQAVAKHQQAVEKTVKPGPGALHGRNTEYPYEVSTGKWMAPSSKGAFAECDVERFCGVADAVFLETCKIVAATRRVGRF